MKIKRLVKKIIRNRFLKLNRDRIQIKETTILKDNFNVFFYVNPENRRYVSVGEKCILNCEVFFESKEGNVSIGNNVYIGGAKLISRERITIGNNVTMSWGITIYDHDSHSIYWEHRMLDNEIQYKEALRGTFVDDKDWTNVVSKPVLIHDNVWIGFDAVILKGVTIGEGAVIGARSVVTKDVEPYTVVAGNPAKFIKRIGENING